MARRGTPARAKAAAALAALAAALAGACADPGGPEPPPRLVARVVDRDDGSPQAGVKLALLDLDRLTVIGPVLTDAAGLAALPAAGGQVMAFPGGGRGVVQLPPPLPAGRNGALTVVTARGAAWEDRLPRISGTVVDADTGEPLGGAFVGTPERPFLDEAAGEVTPREDISDAAGRFHVADIPFALDPENQRLVQALPLLVARQGYLPAAWRHEAGPGDVELDVTGAVIALRRADGNAPAPGVVRGRVRFRGEAVPGVRVGLAYLGEAVAGRGRPATAPTPVAAAGASLPGAVATSDGDGRFALAGVPPGRWLVHPAFGPGDGWTVAAAPEVAVAAGAEVAAVDAAVVRTIAPLVPAPGGVLPDPRASLAWRALAEADSYAVVVDGEVVGVTAVPVWTPPAGAALAPGAHALEILAQDAAGAPVGRTEYRVRFTVAAPSRSR